MAKAVKFALVGAGSIGREFALKYLTLANGAEVCAIVDVSLEQANALASDVTLAKAGGKVVGEKYRQTVLRSGASTAGVSQVAVAASLQEVIGAVDAVFIGTPPSSHADLVELCFAHGKHVLLEKPLAATPADANRILQLQHQHSSFCVNVDIGMRHNKALHVMKEKIDRFDIGRVESLELHLGFQQWPRSWQMQPWVAQREQGGPTREVGTHYLFGLLELMGYDAVVSVNAVAEYADHSADACETAVKGTIMLQNDVPVLVDITTARKDLKRDQYELVVKGEKGSLTLYDFTRLRDGAGNELAEGEYGRSECVVELIKAIHGLPACIVSVNQAWSTQLLVDALLSSNGRTIPIPH